MTRLNPCLFSFRDFRFMGDNAFDGFAHGTIWNGFDNVSVTPAVRDVIAQAFITSGDPDAANDLLEMPLGDDGLVSLANGWATEITRGVKRVRDADIKAAAAMDGLDDAVRSLQDIAGIETGDVAGMFFGGYFESRLDQNILWHHLLPLGREKALREYLRVEALYEGA